MSIDPKQFEDLMKADNEDIVEGVKDILDQQADRLDEEASSLRDLASLLTTMSGRGSFDQIKNEKQ